MDVLTAQDVADRLGLAVRTVHRYRRAGLLNAIRLGGTGPYRFYADSLERFLGGSTSREPSEADLRRRVQEVRLRLGIEPL